MDRVFAKVYVRPEWARKPYSEYTPPVGYSPGSEFLSHDLHIVEFLRDGTRGKDRFLLMFKKGD